MSNSLKYGLIFYIAIFAIFSCKTENPTESRTSAEEAVIAHPLQDSFSRVKTDDISKIDPLIPPKVDGAINVDGGKGYFATFVDPKDLVDQL